MEPRVSLITLGVADLARSIAFYETGLGLKRLAGFENADVAFFPLRGAWLALHPRRTLAEDARVEDSGPAPFAGFTLAHNVHDKAEVDDLLAAAVAAGATLQVPAEEKSWGGYAGYFRDPDGFLWEVAWNPHIDLT